MCSCVCEWVVVNVRTDFGAFIFRIKQVSTPPPQWLTVTSQDITFHPHCYDNLKSHSCPKQGIDGVTRKRAERGTWLCQVWGFACRLNTIKVSVTFFQLQKTEEDNKTCRPGEPEFMKIHARLRARMDSKWSGDGTVSITDQGLT
jgi:hypothetical protein